MKVVDEQNTDQLSCLIETTIWIGLLSKIAVDDAIDQKMYLISEVWTRQWCCSFEL